MQNYGAGYLWALTIIIKMDIIEKNRYRYDEI